MLREPRREITESVVGLAIIGLFSYADYRFAIFMGATKNDPELYVLFMIVGFVISMMIFGVILVGHALGEDICDALARRGLELRPRQRP
jgi:hypothetical protein